MKKYGKLMRVFMERPLAYDDDTESMVGTTDVYTQTKWGKLPPVNINVEDLTKWVDKQIEDGVLVGHIVGKGATRQVEFNDGKTIFKFNYSLQLGNQTRDEIETYYDVKDEWSDCIPKIYDHGLNWSVQEMADNVDTGFVTHTLGVTSKFTLEGLNTTLQTLCTNMSKDIFSYEKLYSFPTYAKAKSYVEYELGRAFYTPALHELIWNKKFRRVMDFAYANGFLWDFRFPNLGVIGDRVVMVDYGYGDKL